MKHILRYTAALFCVVLALTACLPEEPVHETINMGACELTNLSSSAASLMCEIEDELPKYSKIEYGIVYSDNREKVENHKGVKKIEGQGLNENRFTVQLADLKAKQEYFYCSYLRIDEGRMIYGDISSFVTKASYKASFDANGGKGGMEPQHFEEDDNKALTENTFTREHHEFAGWNTKSDGSGSYYQPGSLYTLSEDVKLFAQWQAYSGMEEGYTYVDLGLSVEWATRNVGADRREAYGDYFAWGETQPKSNYAWETYQWGIASDLLTKYCIDAAHGKNGATDGKTVLELSDDAARVQWKGDWRMPTIAEFNELHSQCTWKWGTQNGMNGFVVKGKNGNTIFLPAAGYKNSNELHQAGARGAYWSSSLDDMQSDYAYSLHLLPGAPEQFRYDRYYGYSVRPVYLTYYCVRFDANQGQGKMDSLLISKKKAKLILPDNAFTREGYVFLGWTTSVDGVDGYQPQDEFTLSSDTTFYAQWEINKYELSFDANGGRGEMQPQSYVHGKLQWINVNSFTRDGYIFTGWNTEADGSGTSYTDEQEITLTENITLYAQWEINKYELSFDANGGRGEMQPQSYVHGKLQRINANSFTREDYIFTGWNTALNGSGTSYTDEQEITLTENITLYAQWATYVDLGLSVKWATCNIGATTPEDYGDYFAWGETEPKSDYSWSTYKHGSSSTSLTKYNTDSSIGTVDNKTTLELSDDAARVNWGGKWRMPTKTEQQELINNCTWTWTTQNGISGYKVASKSNGNSIFLPAAGIRHGTSISNVGSYGLYWSSSSLSGGTRLRGHASDLYFLSAGLVRCNNDSRHYGHTVRAVFSDDDKPSTFVTITFNANGGSGTMSAQTFEAGVAQTLKANEFTRDGYVFAGWNTSADGSGTSYTDKQSISISQNTTLYAQWHGTENGHVYVDLGLSVKWATCNIGATTPEDYGDYFAWGETEPKSDYSWETYKYCKGSSNTQTKYCTKSKYGYNGFTDNKTTLELADDAARVNWGGKWRMPTKAEQEELISNCDCEWTTKNGVNGYIVTSKTNGNSIFLPAAGYRGDTYISLAGSGGNYSSSSLNEGLPYGTYYLDFNSSYVAWYGTTRAYGRTVRAVCP